MSYSTRFGSTQTGMTRLRNDLAAKVPQRFSLALDPNAIVIPNRVVAGLGPLQTRIAQILSEFDQYYEAGHRLLIDAVLDFALQPYSAGVFTKPIVGIEQYVNAQGLDVDLNGPVDYVVNRDDSARLDDLTWGNFQALNAGQLLDLLYAFEGGNQAWRGIVSSFVIEAKRTLRTVADDRTYEGQVMAEMVAKAYRGRNAVGAGGQLFVPGILTDGRWYNFYELHMPAIAGGLRNCTYRVSASLSIRTDLADIVGAIRNIYLNLNVTGASKF